MPDLTMVLAVLLGLCLLRLYMLVPRLGPTLVFLCFPGTGDEAEAALHFMQINRRTDWVVRASMGAMATSVGSLGQWALTQAEWTKALTWPLWLPGAVRGTVLGAVVIDRARRAGEGG